MKHDTFDTNPWHIVMVLAGGAAVLLALPALSEMSRPAWHRDYDAILPALRIWMIIGSSTAGFALGWFLSPQASTLRAVVGAIAANLAIFIATFNNDLLGWGLALLLSLIGFCAALGFWLGRFVKALAEPPTTFGPSHWATPEDLQDHGLFEDGGIRIGTAFDGEAHKVITYKGDSHLFTVIKTRGGKSTSQIVPNLLTLPNSVMVIDPKGENAMITAQARKDMEQEVHIFDPWGIVHEEGISAARFNPMDWL